MSTTDERRAEAERRIMHLNGEMSSLMDQISDLESKRDLEPWEERRLDELKARENGINQAIRDAEGDL